MFLSVIWLIVEFLIRYLTLIYNLIGCLTLTCNLIEHLPRKWQFDWLFTLKVAIWLVVYLESGNLIGCLP